MKTRLLPADDAGLKEAAGLLLDGGLVAFPTETVYGLGGLASNPGSIRAIFAAKGRPTTDPLILHLPEPDLEKAVAEGWVAAPLPATAFQLTKVFWPGPLTLILKRGPMVHPEMTAGLETVAVRCPAHPAAQKLLHWVGHPLAAPSANQFGRISPTDAEAVRQELEGKIPLILDGGPSSVGLESTVISLVGPAPEILRPGAITPDQVGRVLPQAPKLRHATTKTEQAQMAPGQLHSHYAPRTPLYLCETPIGAYSQETFHVLFRKPSGSMPHHAVLVGADGDSASAARELYRSLRLADGSGAKAILVDPVPEGPWAEAIRDRLIRASRGTAHWNGQSWEIHPRATA